MKIRGLSALVLAASSSLYSAPDPACMGACSGCTAWYALIPASSLEIKTAYKQMELRVAQRYNDEILPLEEDVKLLEKEVMRKIAHIQAIEEKILLHQKAINYQAELIQAAEATRTSIPKQKTKNKGEQ